MNSFAIRFVMTMLVLLFTVTSAETLAAQGKTPAMETGKSTVTERFLRQFAQNHPLAPGVPSAPVAPRTQTINARDAKTPNVLPHRLPEPASVCSIPLLGQSMDPDKNFSIEHVVPPRIDEAMIRKPAAPTCTDSRFVMKPPDTASARPRR